MPFGSSVGMRFSEVSGRMVMEFVSFSIFERGYINDRV